MLVGRRFRVRFTPDQLAYADEVAGVCRAVWNTGLDQRRQYRQRRAWINYHAAGQRTGRDQTRPRLRLDLAEAPAHCLQQTLMDLDKACRAHGTWKVKFRSKARWSPSFRFPEGKHMRVQRLSKRWAQVNLPKFGQVRFRWTRDLGGTIRSATLTRDGVHGDWYVSPSWSRTAFWKPPLTRHCRRSGSTVVSSWPWPCPTGGCWTRHFTSRARAGGHRPVCNSEPPGSTAPGFPAPVAAKVAAHRPNGGCAPRPGSRRSWPSSAAGGTTSPPRPPAA